VEQEMRLELAPQDVELRLREAALELRRSDLALAILGVIVERRADAENDPVIRVVDMERREEHVAELHRRDDRDQLSLSEPQYDLEHRENDTRDHQDRNRAAPMLERQRESAAERDDA